MNTVVSVLKYYNIINNIKYTILVYNIMCMEENEKEDETFWYHCTRLVKA